MAAVGHMIAFSWLACLAPIRLCMQSQAALAAIAQQPWPTVQ